MSKSTWPGPIVFEHLLLQSGGMFRGMALKEFNKKFVTDEDCRQYLFDIKWKDGYTCHRCGCKKSYPGETKFHRRCQSCEYDESVTAQTIFHKIKFPLIKAFGVAFLVAVRKKGMSTLELSRTFAINQKTAWLFKRKIQEAIKSSFTREKRDSHEIFNIVFGGAESEMSSHFESESQIAEIVLTDCRDYKIGFGTIIKPTVPVSNIPSMHNRNKTADARNKIKEIKKMNEFQNQKNKNQSVVLLNLRNWIRGIHHHCSGRFAQGYLDEFFYRFNMRNNLKMVWHDLINRLMGGKPYFYKSTRPKWIIGNPAATTPQYP